jgi:hypothetical protein
MESSNALLKVTLLLLAFQLALSIEYSDPVEDTKVELQNSIRNKCIPPGYRCPESGDQQCCHGCELTLLLCLNADGTVMKSEDIEGLNRE